jgi:hypothetical protein
MGPDVEIEEEVYADYVESIERKSLGWERGTELEASGPDFLLTSFSLAYTALQRSL